MKKNIGLIITIILLLLVVTGLGFYIFYNQEKDKLEDTGDLKDNSQVQQDETDSYEKSNITIVNDDKCATGCTETITLKNGNENTIYASQLELKVNDTSILELEGASSLKQVTVYDDIIIVLKQISLSCELDIYDINGNLIKTFNLFNDDQGRIFIVYPRYSQEKYFQVDNDGKISIYGTKHIQGEENNNYISDNGNTINLCTQGEFIDENSIVSGIFEFSYLGNNKFSEIKYASTKQTVKDIKTC